MQSVLSSRISYRATIFIDFTVIHTSVGLDRSVGTATGYELDGPGIESRWRRDFPHLSRPAVGSTQPPV
jgi:hypothetical protein